MFFDKVIKNDHSNNLSRVNLSFERFSFSNFNVLLLEINGGNFDIPLVNLCRKFYSSS